MAFDEELAGRALDWFGSDPGVSTKKMFGGLCVLHLGNMVLGVLGEDLMVRVGAEAYADCLALPHAREMDVTGRPLRGMVMVDGAGVADDEALAAWIGRAMDFVAALPPKPGWR
jgi:TfoX/Sxy family transcriptional regulator of competence genes